VKRSSRPAQFKVAARDHWEKPPISIALPAR